MFNIVIGGGPRKYVKCSNCKVFDAINALYQNPKCDRCHQPLKEISEEEYKQKLENLKKFKEEIKKRRRGDGNNNNNNNNNNYRNNDDRPRNNSSLHSSKIQFNDDNNNINMNANNNNINTNNNISHNSRGIRIIKIIGGHHRMGRDNSSDRENNSHHRHHHNMIIITPSIHHHSNNNNNQNNINNNNNININQNIFDNQPRSNRNPFRIMVQRHHVPNNVFDPSFNLFGSTFDHIFQENFSSNFRSNFRGNYLNEIFNILSFNRAEANRKKQHPISEQNLQKLKKFNLTESYCKKGENGKFEKPNCCICLEEIELGKETVLLPCGHMFHSDCCLTWLKKSNTCPICRFEIK